MTRFSMVLTFLASLLAVAGCNEAGPTVDRVQTSLVDKSIFEGEWWYTQAVVDVDGDEAATQYGFTWEGANAYADLGFDSFAVPRIRWVIDEDYLYAYRAYELVVGGNDDGDAEDFRGQPLAAFRIERHVDIRADYNPTTGERTNVRVENSSDRRWYERRYMYVDWSQNHVSSFYGVQTAVDTLTRFESAPFFFEAGAHDDFPASYAPQFVRIGEDEGYKYRDEWPADEKDTVHYMSFVTQNIISPGANCLFYGGFCQAVAATIRHSFLRIPPNHQYPAETETHQEFDRFGLFRAEGRTFIRGNRPNDELERPCDDDADCGTAGTCDVAAGICRGGLERHYGETDFLYFVRPRFNIWKASFREGTSCVGDWQCNDVPGSKCDIVAGRCTIPPEQREIRKVTYHLNAGYPKHLVHAAAEAVGHWNEVFMRGQRVLTGRPLPSGPPIACQRDNPTAYCHCDSPEAVGGTCEWKYDPFMPPDRAEAMGVVEPYDCYVDIVADPAHPTSYDDYTDDVYDFEFVGDECILVLEANSCDRDPEAPCEEQGDLRYQFFNYIQHGGVAFGGVAEPLLDPKTGELIVSDANMAGTSVEAGNYLAVEFFPVLRCQNEELGCAPGEEDADILFTEGESVRRYFSNTGQTWHPQIYQPSGTDGHTLPLDRPRPALPADLHAAFTARMEQVLPRVEQLQGAEGRAQIFSGRMRELAGTDMEARLLSSMGATEGLEPLLATQDLMRIDPDATISDPGILDRISPFRGADLSDLAPATVRRWREISRYNVDPPFDVEFMNQRSRYYEYWAEVFRGVPLAEASIRMQQMLLRSVQHHELGHCMGLRHNFAASFDRSQYLDPAVRLMFEHPLPRLEDYDNPSHGGDANGFVDGEEVNRYYADLREVRNARSKAGMHNFTSNSVMEYAGDLSDFNSHLGRYDVATVMWNQYDLVEGYVGDPRHRSDDSLDRALRSHINERVWFKSYRGGESCEVDSDCPYNSADALLPGQRINQRCIKNPRVSRLPAPCEGDDNCVCSPFDEDFLDFAAGVGYDNDIVVDYDCDGDFVGEGESCVCPESGACRCDVTGDRRCDVHDCDVNGDGDCDDPEDGDGVTDYYPVKYLFCSDERTNDISWCSVFDAGESFQEAVDHWRRTWEEGYPRNYYRRFRRSGPATGASWGMIVDAVKVYQHLFFRYFYEPGFRSETGPLGLDDQYLASIDAMNWLTEIVNLPDVGSYAIDSSTGIYERLGEDLGMPGADISLDIGQGYPLWSKYQDGYSGFFRMERGGVFWDKFLALYGLALRDWNLNFTIDERFYINFYDLFPVEMTEFFGGLMIDDPRWFAPRVVTDGEDAQVQYMSWWRGTCLRGGYYVPCRGSQPETYPGPALGSTSNELMRNWAAMLALAQFPVFYDTSFEQRAQIFKLESGEGWRIPNTQPDGTPTCAYGDYAVDPSHDTGCAPEDADYIVYQSERFHTPYIAVKVRSRISYNLEEEQLGFQLLLRASQLQDRFQTLRAIADPTPEEVAELHAVEDKLISTESFLEYLMDLQRRYGISAYFL